MLPVEDDEDPSAPLTIVSHARAIEQAMRSASVPVEKTAVKHVDTVVRQMAMPAVSLLAPPPPNRSTFDEATSATPPTGWCAPSRTTPSTAA
jgi:hypothetical protein